MGRTVAVIWHVSFSIVAAGLFFFSSSQMARTHGPDIADAGADPADRHRRTDRCRGPAGGIHPAADQASRAVHPGARAAVADRLDLPCTSWQPC